MYFFAATPRFLMPIDYPRRSHNISIQKGRLHVFGSQEPSVQNILRLAAGGPTSAFIA